MFRANQRQVLAEEQLRVSIVNQCYLLCMAVYHQPRSQSRPSSYLHKREGPGNYLPFTRKTCLVSIRANGTRNFDWNITPEAIKKLINSKIFNGRDKYAIKSMELVEKH